MAGGKRAMQMFTARSGRDGSPSGPKHCWDDRAINDGFAETSPVGSFLRVASPFGLEDMAGNVWEWCADYYDAYKGAERTNPQGPRAGSQRILRGGSWKSRFNSLRTSARSWACWL